MSRLNKTLITFTITSIVFLSTPSIYTEENFTVAWKDYVQKPNRHSNIPNNSFAGYQYGEKPIPQYPIVVNAHDYGAEGDGKTESAKAINEAIKAAYEKGGGAVFLPAGVYQLGDEIWMNYNGVVLRGAGPGKTILKVEKNLTETFQGSGKVTKDDKSNWEEAGGFIWFTPETETSIENVKLLWKQGQSDLITSDAAIGEDKLTVGNRSSFTVSDKVIIIYRDDPSETYQKEIFRQLKLAHDYNWSETDPKVFKSNFFYPLEITAINGNTLIFKQPLRLPVRKGTKVAIINKVVQSSGLEDLTIMLKSNNNWIHHQEIGANGIFFDCAWNCWAQNIEILNAETGVSLFSSKCVTISNVSIKGNGKHHGFYAARSSDNLITDFLIEAAVFHGINFDSFSHGNVYSRGDMKHGTFDYHRGLAFDNIITEITINNDGKSTGGDAPRFGARNVHWNIKVTNGNAEMISPANLMPYGAVVGIEGCEIYQEKKEPDYAENVQTIIESPGKRVLPENLYLAQIALRLGSLPVYLKK